MLHKATSFPPIATRNSRVLILGSMPGLKSLSEQQYYAHPQNAFWKIMTTLFYAPVDTYAQRVDLIKGNGLALWDVLKFCERHGSLDTRINDATIEVNDFAAFFKKYPGVTRVFFNGAKSEQEFMKRVLPALPDDVSARLELKRMPSTSPAHAGLKFADKLKAWKAVKV